MISSYSFNPTVTLQHLPRTRDHTAFTIVAILHSIAIRYTWPQVKVARLMSSWYSVSKVKPKNLVYNRQTILRKTTSNCCSCTSKAYSSTISSGSRCSSFNIRYLLLTHYLSHNSVSIKYNLDRPETQRLSSIKEFLIRR